MHNILQVLRYFVHDLQTDARGKSDASIRSVLFYENLIKNVFPDRSLHKKKKLIQNKLIG